MKARQRVKKRTKNKGGRPVTRIIKLDATPEEVARRIFANAKPVDPSLRVHNRGRE